MGGNALSSPSLRLTKLDYVKVSAQCVEKLNARFPDNRLAPLTFYRNKDTFGDLDILCEGPDFDFLAAAESLGAVEFVRNGPVASLGLLVNPEISTRENNMFQVDLIKISAESYDFATGYFGGNDAGNLVGRLAHAMGCTLRHDALVYYFRDDSHMFREIILTRDYAKALAFLGYNATKFQAGFDTLEDIYEFVSSSKYFKRDIFLLENRNATSRVRDRKRSTYMGFLVWCEERPELTSFEYPTCKKQWFDRIAKHFSSFQEEYNQAVEDLAKSHLAKTKFNGQGVSSLTGLVGKDLGLFIRQFKGAFSSFAEMQEYVLSHSPEDIEARVHCEFSRFKELKL